MAYLYLLKKVVRNEVLQYNVRRYTTCFFNL